MLDFVNKSEMPSYLTEALFDLWMNEFNSCLRSISLLPFTPLRLKIEFSQEEKIDTFGSLPVEEIKKRIRESWNLADGVKDELDRIKNYEDYRKHIGRILEEGICRNDSGYDYSSTRKRIAGWFDNIQYSMPILGEYDAYDEKIILYIKNIENAELHGRARTQIVEEVFAHEFFHAYHYKDGNNELFDRYDYTSEIVKESLASAFEWYYCKKNGIPGIDELKQTWSAHPLWTYPYAGTSRLIGYDHTNPENEYLHEEKFIEVFKKSLEDMDGALRILLRYDGYSTNPDCDFYKIKNQIQIRRETIMSKEEPHDYCNVNLFKVCQRQNYDNESLKGYIFAPAQNRYRTMLEVKKGDVLFHIYDGHLYAVSVAATDCYYSSDAHDRRETGWYVDATYLKFSHPVRINQFRHDPDYPIRKEEPYIREFNYPNFIQLILNEAKRENPEDVLCIKLLEEKLGISDLLTEKDTDSNSDLSVGTRFLKTFKYSASGGGPIRMTFDARQDYLEIDRERCIIETYKQAVDSFGRCGEKEEIKSYNVSKDTLDALFNELEKTDWQDGSYFGNARFDWPMWFIDLTYSDGYKCSIRGEKTDGPSNSTSIQRRFDGLLNEAGMQYRSLF